MMKKYFIIENVKEFKYLGILFSRSGSFCKAKKHLCEQAQKAMYGVIRKIRQFKLPVIAGGVRPKIVHFMTQA
jgi:hypothetical protein